MPHFLKLFVAHLCKLLNDLIFIFITHNIQFMSSSVAGQKTVQNLMGGCVKLGSGHLDGDGMKRVTMSKWQW